MKGFKNYLKPLKKHKKHDRVKSVAHENLN